MTKNNRPELDDSNTGDWNVAFSIHARHEGDLNQYYPRYEELVTSMSESIIPVYTLSEDEVIFSMRVFDVSQKQAVLIGFSTTLNAFEAANVPFNLRSARIASRFLIDQAVRDGTQPEMQDITEEVKELQQQILSLRNIDTDELPE